MEPARIAAPATTAEPPQLQNLHHQQQQPPPEPHLPVSSRHRKTSSLTLVSPPPHARDDPSLDPHCRPADNDNNNTNNNNNNNNKQKPLSPAGCRAALHHRSASLPPASLSPISDRDLLFAPSTRGLCIRSTRFDFDDLSALREEEEEEERSLINAASAKLHESFFAANIWAPGSSSPPSSDSLRSTPSSSSTAASTTFSSPSSSNRNSLSSLSVDYFSAHARTRSLTVPPRQSLGRAKRDDDNEMTTFAHPPASPPGLTSSKSSKSSSFRSSTFSNLDGAGPADLSHFEDIGLDDEGLHSARSSLRNSLNKRSSTRSLAGAGGAGMNHSMPPMRELVNGVSRKSSMGGTPKLDANASPVSSLSLPSGARRTTSPARTVGEAALRNRSRSRSRSRSSSPAHMMQGPVSPTSIGRSPILRSGSSFDRRRSGPSPASARPRKTAKEIEAEYNDSDEDLPDDASLWNVPMSPQMYRTASAANSANASANASASTSPERPSAMGTPKTKTADADAAVTPPKGAKTAPVPAREFTPSFKNTPPTPRSPRLNRGNTTGTMPDSYAFGRKRTKSWNNALIELSDEARALSEALDAHESSKVKEADASGKEVPSVDSMPAKPLRASSSVLELPPLRTNNVMIDPLPISKEKEAVLSRTRPSWLPPKDRKEEKKHLKEYQRMMEHSLEAEKRRAEKEASARCARDDTVATLQRLWNDHVIPHWDESIKEPRTRELWWRGIPASLRPAVWARRIGNQLEVSPTTFQKALERARAVETSTSLPSAHSTDVPEEVAWLQAIRRDAGTTLPQLNLFQPGQPLHQPLVDLLSAFAFYRADIGYVFGSHLPAAVLLITLPSPAEAFVALANLLNRPIPQAFLTGDPAGCRRTYDLILRLLQAKRPKLHAHLFAKKEDGGLELDPHEVLEPLLRTTFLAGCCEGLAVDKEGTEGEAPTAAGSWLSKRDSASSVRSDVSAASASKTQQQTPRARGLSLQLALRLWDIIIFDGDGAIIRAAAGVLAARESALYGNKDEVLAILGWGGDLGLDDEEDDKVEEAVTVVRDVGKEERRKSKGEDKAKKEKKDKKEKKKDLGKDGKEQKESGS